MGEKIHQSTKDTTERGYQRLREAGVPKDAALSEARKAAADTHRVVDKRHSDKPPTR